MTTGKINVNTENIFPIIKKFLYSDHDIFLRELISNAVDATQKIKAIAGAGEFKSELGELTITVEMDPKAKTITISDNGIGMTGEEVEKYINQIAFSGAEEFVKKYKDKTDAGNIIGKFGLGFYSSFMVSSKVELISRSYKEAKADGAVKWDCDGSPEYTLVKHKRKKRGTSVILYINDESKEFLETHRIRQILEKFCKFLPVEIQFEGKTINNTKPAWTKKPSELTPEDYDNFYKELYPFSDNPIFNIHLNVDYPFNLTGILYFPKLKKGFEVQKNKIQLYCNQVFVTDSVEGIVPDFLTLLHGVIDSPDIPLNVSRSYLQGDPNVKKISSHITKKVSDRLEEIYKDNRADFEARWDEIKVFIQYGMISDEKFYEKARNYCLLKNTSGQYFTIDEYIQKVKDNQTNKDSKTVLLYASDLHDQHAYVESSSVKGYDVLLLEGQLDIHFINQLESKLENVSFTRVDADTIDKLIDKGEPAISLLTEDQINSLTPLVESQIAKDKFTVIFESLSPEDQPMMVVKPEFGRRMKEMSAMGGGMDFMAAMPERFNMVVNNNHPLYSKVLVEPDQVRQEKLLRHAVDLALLAQNMLKGADLTRFLKRSAELID
jgi:molecular chaperone HtpG